MPLGFAQLMLLTAANKADSSIMAFRHMYGDTKN